MAAYFGVGAFIDFKKLTGIRTRRELVASMIRAASEAFERQFRQTAQSTAPCATKMSPGHAHRLGDTNCRCGRGAENNLSLGKCSEVLEKVDTKEMARRTCAIEGGDDSDDDAAEDGIFDDSEEEHDRDSESELGSDNGNPSCVGADRIPSQYPTEEDDSDSEVDERAEDATLTGSKRSRKYPHAGQTLKKIRVDGKMTAKVVSNGTGLALPKKKRKAAKDLSGPDPTGTTKMAQITRDKRRTGGHGGKQKNAGRISKKAKDEARAKTGQIRSARARTSCRRFRPSRPKQP